jgi:hypothetical protein
LSHRPDGRSLRFHQIWQVRPFWPIRASSWKNRRMRDADMNVFCFAKREHAEQFCEHYGGGEFIDPKDRPN